MFSACFIVSCARTPWSGTHLQTSKTRQYGPLAENYVENVSGFAENSVENVSGFAENSVETQGVYGEKRGEMYGFYIVLGQM